jgi:hypothetical protein
MSTPDDYQAMAEECFRRAQESQAEKESATAIWN